MRGLETPLGRLTLCCCLLAPCAATAALSAQRPDVLTLKQAVNDALLKSDLAVNQRDSIEQANLGLQLARNSFQPKIVPNVLGSFGQTNVSNQTYRVDVAQRFTTGTEVRVGVGTATAQIPSTDPAAPGDVHFYDSDTTLTISQPKRSGGLSPKNRGNLRYAVR